MQIKLEISEHQLKKIILDYLQGVMGTVAVDDKDVYIEVKSKQNWRSQWESAEFRARVEKFV